MLKIHNVEQGTDEWLDLRQKHLTASNAPAMMGESPYCTRNTLIKTLATNERPEVSDYMQGIFERGHKAEADARDLLETETMRNYPAIVGTKNVEGLPLLASLDGYCEETGDIFEHKLWNEKLVLAVEAGELPDQYCWQLEHQMLVFGQNSATFIVSDGTIANRRVLSYQSDDKRRKALIAGWKQFQKDLNDYEPEIEEESIKPTEAHTFPLVTYEVQGSMIVSNIGEVLPAIKAKAEQEMSRKLETDQDFADKDTLNKATKAARTKLKAVIASVKKEFVSFAEFSDIAQEVDSVLQKMQSSGEKQVKDAKTAKKQAIIDAATSKFRAFVDNCDTQIDPLRIHNIATILPDWGTAIKGKRNIESLKNAVDSELAKAKIELNQVLDVVIPNQKYYNDKAADYMFLFRDIEQIINRDTETFKGLVSARIVDHKQLEQERLERATRKDAALQEGKKEAIPPEIQEIIPQEIQEAVPPVSTLEKNINNWAVKYDISALALTALFEILNGE